MPTYLVSSTRRLANAGSPGASAALRACSFLNPNGRKTRERLLQRFPEAQEATASAAAERACDAIASLLRGETCDLSAISLDMSSVPPFHRRVYDAARKIPRGTTTTYGSLAERIGAAGAARAVGQALARNPFAIIVPCHRVVASGGKTGGFSASGGVTTKLRLLVIEGVGDQNAMRCFSELVSAAASHRIE
jgi:methylated-DNA-[protein]-cysteine S-methyltransferase